MIRLAKLQSRFFQPISSHPINPTMSRNPLCNALVHTPSSVGNASLTFQLIF
ncbi:hypothetical protein K443DRAFT_675167 [Laccaria amethystina LaAM-08-1]|uniref:Uncharacterized protein n=1 Tax=Laccaria amethystina LaAM-08-1 TaxID=1095629 RepID=A0A0C9WZU5_9AGAR|nr:hypothetical protein K443DRAFT_675167 [Laccaria amethystina LaAM-08-1]